MSGVSFQTRVDTKDGHKRGFDWFWQVMLELDRKGDWTTTDVARRSVVPGNTVLTYAARLEKGGYIRRTGTRPAARRQSPGAAATTWRIVRPVARAPRLDPDGNERPEFPLSCPRPVTKVIAECWDRDPAARPSFEDLLEKINALLKNES